MLPGGRVSDRYVPDECGTPPPVAAPRRRWRNLLIAVSVTLSVISAVVPAVPRTWYDQQAYDASYGLGRYARLLTPAQRSAVSDAAQSAEAFIADRRGRAFPGDVNVRLLPDADFVAVVRRNTGDNGRLSSDAERALGLITPGGAATSARDSGVITGFYEPGSATVFVRGTHLDEGSTAVLVHEMTHAFDDRYLDLSQLPDNGSSTPDDVADAATALVEGEASEVQLAWIESHSGDPCALAFDQDLPLPAGCDAHDDRQRTSADYEQPAEVVVQEFPYWAGTRFVQALRASGGNAAVDAAFRRPPVDTAQVIEPSLYLAQVKPESVPAPIVAGHTGPRSTLGALGVSVAVNDGVIDVAGSRYLLGWAGDTSVGYREGGRRCLADRLRLRTTALTAVAARRFTSWVKRKPHRSWRRVGPRDLDVRSCT